ncbi:uncharacterized protein LOC135397074 [Ornithodoros turicata]|uniref:uncharacterized protein LOC135397074 n=1 Tax=Ornithodoros turicata TaxID=34597 RepID=UPI00313957F4
MMIITPIFLCLCIAVGANADAKVDESNRYMDKLLEVTFPQRGGVLGWARVEGFKLKVTKRSKGGTGKISIGKREVLSKEGRLHYDDHLSKRSSKARHLREVKVTVDNGTVSGLHGLSRVGDCSAPSWQLGSVVLSCYASLNGITANYEGTLKSETSGVRSMERGELSFEAVIENGKAFIEVSGTPGQPPTLASWSVMPFDVDLKFTGSSFSLDSDLWSMLRSQLKKAIKEKFEQFLYGQLRRGIEVAVTVDPLPMP